MLCNLLKCKNNEKLNDKYSYFCQGLLRRGKEANCLHLEPGGELPPPIVRARYLLARKLVFSRRKLALNGQT